jgi:hypothetical protein
MHLLSSTKKIIHLLEESRGITYGKDIWALKTKDK